VPVGQYDDNHRHDDDDGNGRCWANLLLHPTTTFPYKMAFSIRAQAFLSACGPFQGARTGTDRPALLLFRPRGKGLDLLGADGRIILMLRRELP